MAVQAAAQKALARALKQDVHYSYGNVPGDTWKGREGESYFSGFGLKLPCTFATATIAENS